MILRWFIFVKIFLSGLELISFAQWNVDLCGMFTRTTVDVNVMLLIRKKKRDFNMMLLQIFHFFNIANFPTILLRTKLI